MKYCEKCGTEFQEGASFCIMCGEKAPEVGQPTISGSKPNRYGRHTTGRISNKMSGLIAVGIVAAIVIFLLINLGRLFINPSIVGKWEIISDGASGYIEFFDDNTVSFNGDISDYHANNKTIVVDTGWLWGSIEFSYSISGNTLKMISHSDFPDMVLKRVKQ